MRFFRLTAIAGVPAHIGADSLKKPHHIITLWFSEVVKDHANSFKWNHDKFWHFHDDFSLFLINLMKTWEKVISLLDKVGLSDGTIFLTQTPECGCGLALAKTTCCEQRWWMRGRSDKWVYSDLLRIIYHPGLLSSSGMACIQKTLL